MKQENAEEEKRANSKAKNRLLCTEFHLLSIDVQWPGIATANAVEKREKR